MMKPDGFIASIKLDDEQRDEINKIRTQRVKEYTQIQNALKEQRAKLEVLQTVDESDMKEIIKRLMSCHPYWHRK